MYYLDPYCFDQSDRGWRSLNKNSKIIRVIKKYINKYIDGRSFNDFVPPNEVNDLMHTGYPITLLFWHLGQFYAFENKKKKAIKYMLLSKRFDEDGEHWNRYVDATIAFLKQDKEAFNLALDYSEKDENYNLHVLDSLDRNFDKKYKQAYSQG